jgi:hypothetical protein
MYPARLCVAVEINQVIDMLDVLPIGCLEFAVIPDEVRHILAMRVWSRLHLVQMG